MSTAQLSPAHLEILHALRNTKQKIADLNSVADHLKAQLIDALGDADEATDPQGATVIRYKASRKFDADKAATYFTPEQLQAALKETVDTSALKKMLTGDQLDECMIPGTSRTFTLIDA